MSTGRPRFKVAVVAEQPQRAEALAGELSAVGLDVRHTGGADALELLAQRWPPDIVVLQSRGSLIGPQSLLQRLRTVRPLQSLPFIVVGADDEADQLVAFALGASDCVASPFTARQVAARIGAVLRPRFTATSVSATVASGPVRVDHALKTLIVGGRRVPLTPTETQLLSELIRASDRVLDRGTLMRSVFGIAALTDSRRIDFHIATLRRKLGPFRSWLRTVRGVGFAWRKLPADKPCAVK